MANPFEALEFAFMQRALIAGLLVAIACAIMGTFLVLRGMSLLGDSLAHASFGGIALAFFLGVAPYFVALLVAVVGGIAIHVLEHRRIVRGDTALGIVFAAGLGLGVILVSVAGGYTVDLLSFLFGSILTVTWSDIALYAGLLAVIITVIVGFYKEYLFLTFDKETAAASGLPVHALDIVFVSLTAIAVVVSIKLVGVLLVSALLVLPAATSQLVARSFRQALLLAILCANVAAIAGVLLAYALDWPAGGAIVAVALALLVGTLAAREARRWIAAAPV